MSVTSKRVPVLVPFWVIKQLRRHGLPLNTVLNLPELAKVCSQEDMAVTYMLNQNPSAVFGNNPATHISMGLSGYWTTRSYNAFQSLSAVLPLYEGRLESRLFGDMLDMSNQSVDQPDDLAGKAFEVFEVESGFDTTGAIFLVIHPGYFGGANSKKAQQQIVRAYLKQSYVFCEYHEVAGDPIFSQYLRNLAEPIQAL